MNCIEKSEIYSILFVLDNSGSMKVFGDERNQSLNNFIQVQKDNNLKFNFTLTLFSDDVDIIYKFGLFYGNGCRLLDKENFKNSLN